MTTLGNAKIKVNDKNRQQVKSALLALGYNLGGTTEDAGSYYLDEGFSVVTYMPPNSDDYFSGHRNTEYVLTPWGEFMRASDYFKRPVTEPKPEKQYCKGCNVLTCVGCGEAEAFVETTYEPLPLQPFSQWLGDRMKHLVEHISYSMERSTVVGDDLTAELHALAQLQQQYGEA